MKIVNVIPIAKGANKENLSYFTSKNIGTGALVAVPLRKKIVPAIVSSVREMKEVKAGLKKTQFQLKPVKSVKSSSFLDPDFIESCKEIADYFVSPLGPVIKDFVPQAVLEGADGSDSIAADDHRFPDRHHEIILMQGSQKERFQYYKSIIREEFAKNQSVFFCLPTTNDVDEFSKEVQRGIEKHSIVLHSKISRKKIIKTWNEALREKHPFLIVATKSFLSLPRKDIGTIILEGESSSFYKLRSRPYLDVRKAVEIISKRMKKRLILGDSLIRAETLYQQEPVLSRLLSEAEQIIVDMKEEEAGWQKPKTLSIISTKLQKILKEAYENNEKVVLFINRRGYHPTTVCNDCLATILCEKCDTPLVLHKNNRESAWVCHRCLTEIKTPEQCPYCKGWRMTTLGVGIQKVIEETSRLFPKFKIFRMDSDVIKNAKQGREIAEKFMNTPGAILVGTEILFSYIHHPEDKPFERVAVISIDALFALPDFRIHEKIFNLLLRLRSLAKKTFLVQTRLSPVIYNQLFNDIIKGNVSGFYKTEIENRKQFQYPPFKLLIKITRESKNKLQIKKEVETVKKLFKEWDPVIYPAFISKIKNTYIWNILLRVDPKKWPAPLPSLPPNWKIDVDPETLL